MQPTILTTSPDRVSLGRRYAVRIAFAIPWIIFGIQHYMYADFVSTLVPPYMPWRLFWAYFTGTAMFAAGVSFLIWRQVQLAAFLLGCLMVLYLLMVHPLMIWPEPQVGQHWTRFMQDIAIMGAVFALAILSGGAARPRARVAVRYCYALPIIGLGVQHFTHNAFVTAKVPDWAPFINFWDYVIGIALIAGACGILFSGRAGSPGRAGSSPGMGPSNKGLHMFRIRWAASALGSILMVLALLQHVPHLVTDVHNPGVWTTSLLDFVLAAGAFIIAETVDTEAC